MLPRASLLLLAIGASGCLHHARLTSAREAVETFNAPVKCGPMGFRRVPLAARFGEYVRLTVSSPVPLSGSVMVHANGVANPARVWTSAGDGLVVEARFENTDPDLPSALRATQPIDVTIGELTAPEGGSCEGAVFTLEHGRLVAPTSDALWVAELERRGGAALAARREARRRMSDEELARATESAQPEFSTVLAGWAEAEKEAPTQNVAVAQLNVDGITAQTSIAQAAAPGAPGAQNTAIAQVNLNGVSSQSNADGVTAQPSMVEYAATGAMSTQNTAVAQVNLNGVPSQSGNVAQMNANGVTAQPSMVEYAAPGAMGTQNTAVAQVNLNGTPSQSGNVAQSNADGVTAQPSMVEYAAPGAMGAQNTAVAQVNLNGVPSQSGNVATSVGPQSTAVAQVNVVSGASQAAPDFAHSNDPFAYDAALSQRGAPLEPPPLPSVGAMFPAGCTELSCVVPATQCTQGCTPAPGTCTASGCTVNAQHIEFAVYPRGCVSQTCAMPISRCTGACSRAPGAFIDGVYACPAPVLPTTHAVTDASEWETPASITTQVAHELPRTWSQVAVVAPPPADEVELEVVPLLPWFLGAALSSPHPAPVLTAPPRYAPAPRAGPMHGARPVGSRR